MNIESLDSYQTSDEVAAADSAAPRASALVLGPFVLAAQALGFDIGALLSRFDLSVAQLEDASLRIGHRLIERMLAETTRKPALRDLGLLAAERVQSPHLDVLEYLARVQPTLWSAFECSQRYVGLLHDSCEVSVTALDSRAIVEVRFNSAAHDSLFEFVLAVHLLAARRITGDPTLAPLEVCFSHPRPPSTVEHQRIFRAPLSFNRSEAALIFPRAALEAQLPSADPGLADLLDRVAATSLDKIGRRVDLAEQTRELIKKTIRQGPVQAEHIAHRLGMSTRTLHRKLVQLGTTYRTIVDGVRRELAMHSLLNTRLSTTQIADKLGFANGPAFHRAFRRWTGTTATAYRSEMRKTASPQR